MFVPNLSWQNDRCYILVGQKCRFPQGAHWNLTSAGELVSQVRKRLFCTTLYTKTEHLSRQARDKHRRKLRKGRDVFSQMGVEVWRSGSSDKKGQVPPPPGVAGPCMVPRRGAPNKYGPLQLWSKPQPGGTAAVFIQSTVRTKTNRMMRTHHLHLHIDAHDNVHRHRSI